METLARPERARIVQLDEDISDKDKRIKILQETIKMYEENETTRIHNNYFSHRPSAAQGLGSCSSRPQPMPCCHLNHCQGMSRDSCSTTQMAHHAPRSCVYDHTEGDKSSSSDSLSQLLEIKESLKHLETTMSEFRQSLSKLLSLAPFLAASSCHQEVPSEENPESDISVVSMDADDPLLNVNLNV